MHGVRHFVTLDADVGWVLYHIAGTEELIGRGIVKLAREGFLHNHLQVRTAEKYLDQRL